jgi:hypothetical protein
VKSENSRACVTVKESVQISDSAVLKCDYENL